MIEPWVKLGDSRGKCAVVLGPVSPAFDDGAFCDVLSDALVERGFGVVVVDTPSLVGSLACKRGAAGVVEGLAQQLPVPTSDIAMLAGYALGGTLAVKLCGYLPEVPRVLSLSGPGFTDVPLRRGITPLMHALQAGLLEKSLELLAESVAPLGHAPSAQHRDTLRLDSEQAQLAMQRMLAGFGLLLELDARADAERYTGKILAIVGERSQLATVANQAFAPGPHRRIVSVPGAGMRVLRDAPDFTIRAVEDWLDA